MNSKGEHSYKVKHNVEDWYLTVEELRELINSLQQAKDGTTIIVYNNKLANPALVNNSDLVKEVTMSVVQYLKSEDLIKMRARWHNI